jgi:hypothetical protein
MVHLTRMWSYTVTRWLVKGPAALLQMSMDAIYETLVAPAGGSVPSTPKRGARLVRFASTPPGVGHLCAAGCELLSQLLLLVPLQCQHGSLSLA